MKLSLVLFVYSIWATATFAAPTTQPTSPPDVLIIPFKSLSDTTNEFTLGRAVQQNLLADLGRAKLHPAQENDLNAEPQSAVRAAGAKYAISGTWQAIDEQIRFTGEITDARTGAIVGGLNATGSSRDLFALEDALSAQAVHQLHQLETPPLPPAAIAAQPAAATEVATPANPPINLHPYQGSELESYVYNNRTPSNDYNYQLTQSQNNQTYSYYAANSYFNSYGYGYGFPIYSGISFGYFPYYGGIHPGRHLPLR